MHERFYNLPEDVDWLFSVHLRDFSAEQNNVHSFTLEGSEDCPLHITTFASDDPTIHDTPLATYELQEDLTYLKM